MHSEYAINYRAVQAALSRRLARDDATLTTSSEATIHIAMIDNLGIRITGESTP